VDLSVLQNCPPLFSVLLLKSAVLRVRVLYILLNSLQPPQIRFSYRLSAFWFKKSELSARILFLHSTVVLSFLFPLLNKVKTAPGNGSRSNRESAFIIRNAHMLHIPAKLVTGDAF